MILFDIDIVCLFILMINPIKQNKFFNTFIDYNLVPFIQYNTPSIKLNEFD
jgi:hypothetical protein